MARSHTPTRPSIPDDGPLPSPRRSPLDRMGIPRTLAWGYLGLVVFMIGDGIEVDYLSPYLVDLGFSESGVGLVFTVYGIAAAVGAFLAGALSDAWGPRRVMAVGAAFWASSTSCCLPSPSRPRAIR
ncbi:MFS transporter [Streptomyces sp. NPDC002851]